MKSSLVILAALLAVAQPAAGQTVDKLLTAPANFEDISVGPDGSLFLVSAPGGNVVWKVTPGGSLSTYAQNMQGPLGGAVGPDGTVYVSMWNTARIQAIAPDGTQSPVATGISGPTGIAVANDPRYIYAASYNWGAIYLIDTQTGTRAVLENGPEIYGPDGIVVDENDNLYLANFLDSRIHKRSASGDLELLATLPGSGTGYIDYRDGVLYVAGLNTHVIYRVDAVTGAWSVLAGTGQPGAVDGPLLQAQFNAPNGLALSPDGQYLYIGESGRLRRISLDGVAGAVETLPAPLDLHGAAPNPFNPRTTIRFALDQDREVRVSVLDVRGFRVAELFAGYLPAGEHELAWDGRDSAGRATASGTYFVQAVTGAATATSKMVLAR